ncbi:MAG: 50S ribosomal protein L13 [Candidatus Omnitrophota bacterium]|nr:MAG: 50S ribosomal protein L13 [Candidatus Omnitrophota bacterium]
MNTFMQKTKDVRRNWYVIDAQGKILGRLATGIASLLRGKTKPEFTPHVDMADEIIVINAAKIHVTGNKIKDKKYQTYSGYSRGQKEFTLETMLKKKPEEVIKHAVRGMLPHNSLGRSLLRKLKVYAGKEHKHSAQKPQELLKI